MILQSPPLELLPVLAGLLQSGLLLAVVALGLGFLGAAVRSGPLQGGDQVFRALRTAAVDLSHTSPRRVLALARLAIIESSRRKVFWSLGVFAAVLMFAPWFLDSDVPDPAAQHLELVLNWCTLLSVAVTGLLSLSSLPADIKHKTIFTVVTKPVRATEIVLGRILGFSLIGAAMLLVMGLISYAFVLRSLSHAHQVEVASFRSASDDAGGGASGQTDASQGHQHQVHLWPDGSATTSVERGHWHDVTVDRSGAQPAYALGAPRGQLVARRPVYGQLSFRDRRGKEATQGISVGKEWKYRSYLVGNSQAAGVWRFQGVTPAAFPAAEFPEGLPLTLSISVFRAYKGDEVSFQHGVAGSIQLRNPRTGLACQRIPFRAKERLDRRAIPWQLKDGGGRPLDLMRDLVADGEVEIWIQCLDHEQYFGIAQNDAFLHAVDASYAGNFAKAFAGVWLQVVLAVSFGVALTTLVGTPVAALAELAVLLFGWCKPWILETSRKVVEGTQEGGGAIEAGIRVVQQHNVVSKLEDGVGTTTVQTLDRLIMWLMEQVVTPLPNFRQFDNSSYLIQGFDLPGSVLVAQLAAAGCYVIGLTVAGYFFLRLREVAR